MERFLVLSVRPSIICLLTKIEIRTLDIPGRVDFFTFLSGDLERNTHNYMQVFMLFDRFLGHKNASQVCKLVILPPQKEFSQR